MKKLLSLITCIIMIFISGCEMNTSTSLPSSVAEDKEITSSSQNEMRAVWLSYLELDYTEATQDDFINDITSKFDDIKNAGFNTVICHVRANCDAAYPSKYFPFSEKYSGVKGTKPQFDPLQIMVEAAKARNLRIEAWINPYRVSQKTNDITSLSRDNPARIWAENEKTSNNVLYTDSGIYLNPASEEVRSLIINGIDEILQNYDVDGIHFDDYFYPTANKDFDKKSYAEYKKENEVFLPLDDWRRTNVSLLISECYNTVHKYEDKTFGISPTAAIREDKTDKNFSEYFADIYTWMSTTGYIDYIAPQLYFGFEYPEEDFRFSNLLEAWKNAERLENVKLYIGLAAYKIGLQDGDSNEWQTHSDIISRQIDALRKTNADGYMIYSYSGLFSKDVSNKKELKKIKEMNEII